MNIMKKNQDGQGLTEYAVILSLVAVASIAAMAFFGGAVKGKIASLSGAVAGRSESEITAADKKAKDIAKKGADKASKVKGNTSIDGETTFDVENF